MKVFNLIESEPNTDYTIYTGSYEECVHKFVEQFGIAFDQGIEIGYTRYFIEEIPNILDEIYEDTKSK